MNTESKGAMNEVDVLLAQIKRIRDNCLHDFKPIPGSFSLGKSKVAGVLLGSIEGTAIRISCRCSKCSVEKAMTAAEYCPGCGGQMKQGEMHYRDEYFPERHLYHGARLHTCESCGLTVAMDEWDQ